MLVSKTNKIGTAAENVEKLDMKLKMLIMLHVDHAHLVSLKYSCTHNPSTEHVTAVCGSQGSGRI